MTSATMIKLNKAIQEVREEAILNAIDAFVATLKAEFEIDELDTFTETYKAKISQQLKDEIKDASKKPKKAPKLDADGNLVKREPSEYNKFIKEALIRLKKENPEQSGKDLMTLAAAEWKKSKTATATTDSE